MYDKKYSSKSYSLPHDHALLVRLRTPGADAGSEIRKNEKLNCAQNQRRKRAVPILYGNASDGHVLRGLAPGAGCPALLLLES
jgi:hypothetical protein